mmetsp:Transcript_3667/g.7860  ORF Transcript_3667/g.7860 Transcript_3667/m.7860 type:complete len:429 (+) Transcript_3667:148-1434(+)
MRQVGKDWDLADTAQSFIPLSLGLGVFIGTISSGYLIDRYGRMFVFKKTLLLSGFVGLAAAFSYDLSMLCLLFFGMGVGLGGDIMTVSATYIEHCPTQYRYTLNLLNVLCAVGAAFPLALALLLIAVGAPYMWRFVVGGLSVICLIVCVVRLKMFETPIYYFSCRQVDKAFEVLDKIARMNGRPDDDDVTTPLKPINASTIEPNHTEQKLSMSRQIHRLLGSQFKRILFLQVAVLFMQIWFLTSFTSSGIGMFLPVFITRAGGSQSSSDVSIYTSMLLISLGGIPSTVFTSWLMSTRLKRKKSLVISFALTAFFLTALVWGGFSYYFVIGALALYYFSIISVYAIVYSMTPECFPGDIRGTALSICSGANRVGTMVGPIVAGLILDSYSGIFVAMVLFVCCCLAGSGCSVFLRETKGANADEGIIMHS